MADANDLVITCYDRAFGRKGWISNPIGYELTPQHHRAGSGTITMARDDDKLAYAMLRGGRFVVSYLDEDTWSGYFRDPTGSLLRTGTTTVALSGDWRALPGTPAWVRPDKPAVPTSLDDEGQASVLDPTVHLAGTIQGQGGYYPWPAGPVSAETVIKTLASANLVGRLHRPFLIEADAGRGGDTRAGGVLPDVRNGTIEDYVLPVLAWAGLGCRVIQHRGAAGISIEVWQPKVWAQELTVESGIVRDGTWSLKYPTATRALVGGNGEDAARLFDATVDQSSLDLEAAYGEIIEVFRDATGFTFNWPKTAPDDNGTTSDVLDDAHRVEKYFPLQPEVADTEKAALVTYLAQNRAAALADGAPTAGVSATLSETKAFRFGGPNGRHLGDIVTIRSGERDAPNALRFQAPIASVTFSLSRESGFSVTPAVGDITTASRRTARQIRRVAASLRKLQARR